MEGFLSFIPDESTAYQFCLQFGVVNREVTCECGNAMRLQINQQKDNGMVFACTSMRSVFRKTKSALFGYFFYRSRLDICIALKCIAGYSANLSGEQLSFYTGIRSPSTITNWRAHFRVVCSRAIENQLHHKIGGRDLTVEIDETLLFRRKAHTGRLLSNEDQGVWFIGGVCRETRDSFVLNVRRRDAETLRDAINENIEPGMRLITDCWRGYANLSHYGWVDEQVNHSINFVNPEDPDIHTQTIERM